MRRLGRIPCLPSCQSCRWAPLGFCFVSGRPGRILVAVTRSRHPPLNSHQCGLLPPVMRIGRPPQPTNTLTTEPGTAHQLTSPPAHQSPPIPSHQSPAQPTNTLAPEPSTAHQPTSTPAHQYPHKTPANQPKPSQHTSPPAHQYPHNTPHPTSPPIPSQHTRAHQPTNTLTTHQPTNTLTTHQSPPESCYHRCLEFPLSAKAGYNRV